MANLYDKAQYIFVAGANKSGSIYGLSPIPGTTNVTLVSSSTTRASSGSRTNSNGIIERVAPHILRVDYSDLVTCPSYKFEPQRANYINVSDHLSTGSGEIYWTAQNATWSLVSDSTAPVGTGFSALLKESTAAPGLGGKFIRAVSYIAPFDAATATSSSFTLSVYAKRSGSGADARNIMLFPGSNAETNGIFFVLQGTGSIASYSTVNQYVSGAFIEPLPNNWYRCSILVNARGIVPSFRVYLTSGSNNNNDWSYTGNGTAAVYLCAAQMESGSAHGINSRAASLTTGTYATAYISSSTTLVTRNADNAIAISGSSVSTEWTAFIAYKKSVPEGGNTGFDIRIGSGSGITPAFFAGLYNNGVAIWNSASSDTRVSGSILPIGVEHKHAIRLSGSQMSWFTNGSFRFSIPWSPSPAPWSSVLIGDQTTNATFSQPSSYYVRAVAMFSQSLSNAECILLTATGSGTV